MSEPKKLPISPADLKWLGDSFKLAEVPPFEMADLAKSLPSLSLTEVPAHTSILREGDTGSDVYMLYQGLVSVNKKKGMFGAVEVVRLQPGDYFGEIAFLGRASRSATVTTEKDSKVFSIQAAEFKTLLAAKPQLAEHLKKVAEARLKKLAEIDR